MNTWRFPSYLFVLALLFCAGRSAFAETWIGGFLSKSGITWNYEVRKDNSRVSVNVNGDRQGTNFAAWCAETALDATESFEAECEYIGSPLTFKLRGRLKADEEFVNYLANNGDTTSVKVLRQATAPSVNQPPQVAVVPRPTSPAPVAPRSSLQLLNCERADFLMNYTRHSFVNGDDPILGVRASEWTLDTLQAAKDWFEKCAAQSQQRGQATRLLGIWDAFQRDAVAGMELRKQNDQKAEATRKAEDALVDRWNRPTALSAGGSISCRLLGTTTDYGIALDGPLFGQALRDYTSADFQTLLTTLSACDAVDWNRGRQQYTPERRELNALSQRREALLRAELAAKDRAQIAQEKAREEQQHEATVIDKALSVATALEQNPRTFGGTWPDVPRANSVKLVEPPQCNDPRVLTFFFNGLYRKNVEPILRRFREKPLPETAQQVLGVAAWKIAIENIRQTDFNPNTRVRQCAATFQSNDNKLDWGNVEGISMPGLALGILQCSYLTQQLSYRLELLLDKPTEFYVSYGCR